MGEAANLVLPLQTSSLDSAHDQNVRNAFRSGSVVAPAEWIVPIRQLSQASKDAVLDAALDIVQATAREGECYL